MKNSLMHTVAVWVGVACVLLAARSAGASGEVWIASGNGSQLVRMNSTGDVLLTVTLPGPVFGVAVDGSGKAWVARTDAPVVHQVAVDGALISTIETGAVVRSLALAADGSLWAVRPAHHDVVRLDATGVVTAYAVGSVPYGVAIDVAGQVWVTNTFGASVSRIDAVAGTVSAFPVDLFPTGIAAHPDGSIWVVSKESVQRLSATGSVIFSATAGLQSRGVTVDADGQVWVTNEVSNDVYRFAADGTWLGSVAVGQRPWGVAARGAGGVYVLCSLGNGVWSLDPSGSVTAVLVMTAPHAFGDLTGLAHARVVNPAGDADGDSHANAFEVAYDFDPLDAASFPIVFLRGDSDGSGTVDLADGVKILAYLFQADALACVEAADVNDDSSVNLLDAVWLFGFVIQGSAPPAAPFPLAGFDPAPRDGLPCQ